MTERQLVLEALNFKEPMVIPYTLYLDKELTCRLVKEWEAENHTVRILWRIEQKEFADHFIDRFGVRWDRSAAGDYMYSGDFLPEPDPAGIPEIEFITDADVHEIMSVRRANPDKFVYFQFTTSLSGRLAAFRGMDGYLMDLALHPRFIEETLEKLLAMHMRALDRLLALPVDGIVFGDDFGSQKGLLISPETFRRFFRPVYRKIAERIRSGGKIVGLHSCGNNTELMGEFVDVGIQFFHPLQPECMDISRMKREYGKHITFRGGIGVQRAVSFGTAEEAKREVLGAAKILSAGGGYLMETVKPLTTDISLENVQAVVDGIRQASRYRF